MSIEIYDVSVPVFISTLENLDRILQLSSYHITQKAIDESVFLTARLAPDMFNLTRQVQITCDFAKNTVARLANVEITNIPDIETSFAELRGRISKTIRFLNSITPEQVNDSAGKDIIFPVRGTTMTMKGLPYLLNFGLANFYFHHVTAYNILRNNGVELSKRNYLGWA